MKSTLGRMVVWSAILSVVFIGCIVVSLAVGVEYIDLFRALSQPESTAGQIFYQARLGRVLLGALVGAALAPAGLAFQAMLRNPLADPFVLGVSGGASVMATIAVVVLGSGWLGSWTVPAWAFVGAMGAIVVVFGFGRVRGRLVPEVALLAGVVLNALASALIVAIRLLASPQKSHEALYWLTGSLQPTETSRLIALVVYIGVALISLMRDAHAMNVFSLGDETAFSVGVDVERARRRIFLSASLLTAAAVAFAGPVGFVGIIVPHVARALLGPDHRLLVPVCALGGGAFVVVADTLARLSFLWLEKEPTVGVLTALAGAPFFLAVLRRRGMR